MFDLSYSTSSKSQDFGPPTERRSGKPNLQINLSFKSLTTGHWPFSNTQNSKDNKIHSGSTEPKKYDRSPAQNEEDEREHCVIVRPCKS